MPRRSKRPSQTEQLSPDPDRPYETPAVSSPPDSDLSDNDHAPPEEPGVSLESILGPEEDQELVGMPVAQVISDGTLEAANQDEFSIPLTQALVNAVPDVIAEPAQTELDLRSGVIVSASLFDQPISDPEEQEEDEEDQDAAEPDVTRVAPFRQPVIRSDDPSDVDDARAEEIQRLLDERVKRRLRVQRLPKEEPLEQGRAPEPREPRRS
jgi:hypothetical protein